MTSSFAQVGQVRTLLDKLSRHVEEVQKRHVFVLSNPTQEQSESRTSRKMQSDVDHHPQGALALAYVSFSPYLVNRLIGLFLLKLVQEIVRIKLQNSTKTSDVSKISKLHRERFLQVDGGGVRSPSST